jgi:nucleoside-diphosphate-sugar epimerase
MRVNNTSINLTDFVSGSNYRELSSFYSQKKVTVTGGASFIGSHLVDQLLILGAKVTVLDDLSSGKLSNLQENENLEFVEVDLADRNLTNQYIGKGDVLFHLAAIHGGRGFIETYQKLMLANLAIDNNVFNAAVSQEFEMVVHASSACAYPLRNQSSSTDLKYLAEDMSEIGEGLESSADGVYGWTKLMGEYQLKTLSSDKTRGRSARIFTAYGERENESHAAIALIAKGLLKIDPYPIWGTGDQTRNFTYVADTVLGLLFLGADSRGEVFDAVNVGTSKHNTVLEFIEEIFAKTGWRPSKIDKQLDKPMGVASRASDNTKIRQLFGWEPETEIEVGISRTLDWYQALTDRPQNEKELNSRLNSR